MQTIAKPDFKQGKQLLKLDGQEWIESSIRFLGPLLLYIPHAHTASTK